MRNETLPSYTPDDYYERRVSLFAQLKAKHNDIIMLGDSLINGCEWHELLDNSRIKNRGINSDTAEGVMLRLADTLQDPPAQLFVMVGINDVSHNEEAHTIADKITAIAQKVRSLSPSTQLYLHSLLPFDASLHYTSLAGKESVVREVNDLLQANATRYDYTYIDVYSHFLAPDSHCINLAYSNDGLHLNGNGYELWGELLRPYIDE